MKQQVYPCLTLTKAKKVFFSQIFQLKDTIDLLAFSLSLTILLQQLNISFFHPPASLRVINDLIKRDNYT